MIALEVVQANYEAMGRAKGLAENLARGFAKDLVKGKAEGMANVFLAVAKQRFPDVPKHLAARVRRASARQIDAWVKQLPDAPDLETLLNGGVNGKPRR